MKIINSLVIFFSMLLFSSCIDEQVIVDNTLKPQGKIVVNSEPVGAKIFFLGTDTRKVTPDSLMNLESGTFDLTLKHNGYRDTTFIVTVLNNHTTTKNILMEEFQSGTIYVDSDPKGAQIYLGGKYTQKSTPDSLVNIEPGVYSLSLKLPGFRDTSLNVTVQNRLTAQMNILLKDTLPELTINIGYSKIQFGQLLFTFAFNRNIKLTEIIAEPPGREELSTDFDNESVAIGEERILIFPNGVNGNWIFTIKGENADGDKRAFERRQSVDVK